MKEYSIDQSPFFKCQQKKKLAKILGVKVSELKKIEKNRKYREFTNRKGRIVYEPSPYLKKLQSKVNELLSRLEKPLWLQGGIKKRSNLTNSNRHIHSHYFLVLDIKKFYEHCHREYIYLYFKNKMLMSSDCSKIMTDICTFNGKLVTGSPSSVLISFFSYQDMFVEVCSLLSEDQILSVYIDDITISSVAPIEDPNNLKNKIDKILKKYGHSLNLEKSHYLGKSKFKNITGVVVTPDNELRVSNEHRKKIIDGVRKIDKTEDYKEISKLSGRLAYVGRIEPHIFANIKAKQEKRKHR
ncbi:MAG: reverse transcriptase [Bacillales bacterium]|jgi:hypothetical protein|nr:reverse transcriptase [Bacillales bacterium]